jgi:DNA mismatch repair protein MutL
LLPIGRYPIAVLHITLDPTLIDVNVHPAKLEARISKEKELCQLIESSIKETFHRTSLVPSIKKEPNKKKTLSEQQAMRFDQHVNRPSDNNASQVNTAPVQPYPAYVREDQPEEDTFIDSVQHKGQPKQDEETDHADCSAQFPIDNEAEKEQTQPLNDEYQEESTEQKRMPALYPIGQMHGTYILAQNENGLYIIDQHAAQERIKYEFFREKVGQTSKELQELLVPITFEFSAGEYAVISSFEDYLTEMGLNFEEFGQNTYIVRAHPQWFPSGKEQETIEDIIQALLENKNITVKELREELAIMMSCKKSIKANRYLKTEEIDALLYQLSQAGDPFTCPHGRPVIIHFTTYEMEKLFKRVM